MTRMGLHLRNPVTSHVKTRTSDRRQLMLHQKCLGRPLFRVGGHCSQEPAIFQILTCNQAFFFSFSDGGREKGRKKERLIQLLHESSAASLDSELLSHWSKTKRFFEPRYSWLHDCMFDFRCNFKIMAAAEGNAKSEFFAALTSSLEDFIHKSLKDEQTECIRRILCLEEDVLAVLPTGFGKSVIYQLIPKVRMKKLHPSSGFKTSVVVVSPLEYIRKQQV